MFRRPATRKTQPGREVSEVYPWPAPVKGWFDSESIADMPEGSAYRLDNWFPESTSLKVRPGSTQYSRLLGPGETTVATMYATLMPQTALIGRSRARTSSRGTPNRLGSHLLASSGYVTRRGTGCVQGGDNGDADGV